MNPSVPQDTPASKLDNDNNDNDNDDIQFTTVIPTHLSKSHHDPVPLSNTLRHAVSMSSASSAQAASQGGENGAHAQEQGQSSPHGHSQLHHHSNSMPPSTTPLFQLVNFPSRLVLENVYLNGLHSLRRFGIKNTSQTDIVVKMRSSLGPQISFQLTNENLPFDPDATGNPLQVISTNTAAAAEAGSTGLQFNQLFNHVNLIDEVAVAAGETEYVILGFLPEPKGKSRRSTSTAADGTNNNSGNGSAFGEGVQIYDDSRQRDISANGLANDSNIDAEDFDSNDQQTDSFDAFEVNGLVFFFAYKIIMPSAGSKGSTADLTQSHTESGLPESPTSIHASSDPNTSLSGITTTATQTGGGKAMTGSTQNAGNSSSVGPSTAPHKADYQHTVKFRSTVCRSVLYSNIGETGINFEDCVANREYVKDFTIRNKSEIPLYWQLNTVDVSSASRENWLRFVDYEDSYGGAGAEDTAEHVEEQGQHSKIVQFKPIPSYDYRRIRVIFRPKENGDFLFDLLLENLNDASNIEEATIHAAVRVVLRGEDTLTISSGNTMDFGDCCAGVWTRLPLTFTNTGLTPTEIHLKVEGAEVVFDIQTEAGTEVSDTAADLSKEGKFLLDPDIQPSWYESSRRSESSANTDHPDYSSSGGQVGRSRLRDWMEDGPQSPGAHGFVSSAPSVADSAGTKGDRAGREQGLLTESGPSSPVLSDGYFPDGAHPINPTVANYLAGQDLARPPIEGNEDDGESEADTTSVQDSLTAGNVIGHKKRPSLRSISFSGAQREKELIQAQIHAPKSPIRGNQSTTRIEELFVKPGKERTVVVSYRPTRDASIEDFQAGKLLKKSFRIIVAYAPWGGLASTVPFSENPQRDRKIIQCKARACTSFVTFEPKALDFGDTDVGALKSLPIKLMNQSEIPAVVQLDFQSKVLNCSPSGPITLPPKSSTELKLDIYPRKVNPDYRKQLTLFNFTNRANDQIIEVRSTNIDKNRVTFHSLFYRVLYPGGTNFLDFGNVVVGGVSLRTITISNFTKNWLTLEVTTDLCGELSVYERAREHRDYLNLNKVSGLLSSDQDTVPATQGAIRSAAHSPITRSGTLSTAGSGRTAPHDGSKSALLKRRQDQREPHSNATSESGTPAAIGGGTLASSLALKAKAILFHGDVSQGAGSSSSGFLDLATNKPQEVKKIIRRIPTMKELLEPTAQPKSKSTTDRTGKTSGPGHLESSSRSPRSNAVSQQSPSVGNTDPSKRSDATTISAQRQQDPKTPQGEGAQQAGADGKQEENSLLSSRTLESVLAAMDAGSSTGGSMLFYKPADEERYVKEKMKLTRELQNAIASGELAPISVVSVPPETEHQLVVLFTPSSTFRDHIKGIPKNQGASIYLRLVDFDQETVANNPQFRPLLDGDLSQIPLREIMVRSSLVRSIMDLGQNNINFGNMDKGEKRTKTIVIQNRSKEPLLYHIRKSGSIASGDIVLGNGKSGVVRGYSKKEVDFIFEPSLSGLYHERLAIENIQDPDSSRMLSVKANIRKPKHFSIDCPEVDFGTCAVDHKTESKRITVTNSTKQTRTFEVRVDPHEMMPLASGTHLGGEIEFTLEDDPGQAVVTKEMEDEIEILEQKLKIAKRKGREDKVKKVAARLSLLRKGGVEDKVEPSKPADDATPTQEKVLEFGNTDQINSPIVDSVTKGTASTTPTTATPATTPTVKDMPKFKRTDHSIVFTLEGGKTKSVSAYFTALCDPSYVSEGIGAKERTRLQGKIYVHEHKNRDICRDVMFTAMVEPLLVQADDCTEETPKPILPGAAGDSKAAKKAAKKAAAAKEAKAEEKDVEKAVGSVGVEGEKITKEPEPPVEHFSLSPAEFDGGKVELDQKGTFYFKLSNTSDSPLPYRIDLNSNLDGGVSRFVLEEQELEGSLEPKEVKRVMFGYLTHDLGRLRDSLRVINLISQVSHEFVFSCYSHRAQYLAFPSLDESMKLDLGHCYVDTGRKYSQVTPLLVENITDDDVYIACASNLAQQVGIYLDEQAEKGQVTKTLLKKRSMVTVWVAVQPNLLGGIAGGNSSRRAATSSSGLSSTTHDRDSECRTLVGGIKFSVSVPNSPAVVDTEETLTQVLSQTVKFTSIIGRSILSVSDTLLNLGWTPEVGRPVYGSFTLQNMSSRLPLDFQIESLSGNIILDRTGGILDGWEVDTQPAGNRDHMDKDRFKDGNEDDEDNDASEMAPTDRSRLWISFRVTASTPGLFTDTILVTNKNNCSQKIHIKVRLFVDHNRLSTILHGPFYTCPMALEESPEDLEIKPGAPREGLALPNLSWEDVYVSVADDEDVGAQESRPLVTFQPQLGQEAARVSDRWVELLNNGDEVMELVPLCDINADVIWERGSPPSTPALLSETTTKAIDGFHACGSIIRLAPGQKAHLAISCPAPELSTSEAQQLQSGKSVSLVGTLMVVDQVKDQVMKVLGLSSSFGVSYAEVVPLSTDLGKIGHYNSWSPVKISFEVKNSSEIPLFYEIVLQDYMNLTAVHSMSEEGSTHQHSPTMGTKRRIQSHDADSIEVLLDPRRIENFEIGRRIFPIRILNLHNPLNEPVFNVSAVLTEFELGFDRLTDGMLVLPPLTHPLPSSALPCDAWFSITNKSLEDVKFEIGATLSPDVVDYVHLDVLSRFSNSPLRGSITLSSRGSIGVRIRAFPKEGSRLPSDTSALCTPDGLTFGNLWVSTKPLTAEEGSSSKRFAQNIPIRGALVEGSMFSLSTQRIVFRSLMQSSDYEDDSDDEQLSVPDSTALSSSKDVSDDGMGPDVQKATITVSNLSMTFPLDFQMTLEGPMEYPAAEIIRVTPLDSNNCGVVEAGQQLKLVVELIDPHLIISEDIKLYIRNLNSKLGQQQRVLISLVSDNREHRKPNKKHIIEDERIDPHHHQNKLEEPVVASVNGGLPNVAHSSAVLEMDASAMQPIISLRGCKRIDSGDASGGRFELDLGQQDLGSANVLRKLVLENPGYDRVSYRIKTISALDKNWIKISRLDGTLEPPSEEQLSTGSSSVHTITLGFVTNVRNVFSTYLLIENVDNPADTKTIRVTMEVVARQNLRRATKGNEANNRVFDVFVNGIDHKNSSTIDMKNLFYGSEYTARSMVVYNRESVPMEFTFKSNLSPSDTTEILFSTSRTSAKLFKTLTVPSENHVRVYIRFFPRPSAAIQAALENGESRDPDEVELKTVEIYINCRLVKDYQQVVVLTAECYMPAIRVYWQDSVSFVARLSRESSGSTENADEWKLSFKEDYRILGISNLLQIPLEYEIVNDTMYFNLEYPEPDKVVDGLDKHEIRVVPNVKALLRNAENFRREKYVQENITIYNRNRPLENYWIPLRLSLGNVSNFQLSSGYKSSYAFGMIEQHVVNFLSDFNSHAVLVNMGSSCFPGAVSSTGAGNGLMSNTSSSFSLASIGLGPDRSSSPGSNHSSPLLLSSGLTTLISPPNSGPVAGMLGLGRSTSPLAAATSSYHPPSHHPHYQSVEAQETQRKLIDLEFQYHYVVDQLVYYSTIKTGENFFQLASLLFCSLLGNRIFQIWSPAYLKDPRAATLAAGGSGPGTGNGTTAPGSGGSGGGGVENEENGESRQQMPYQTGVNGFTMQSHNGTYPNNVQQQQQQQPYPLFRGQDDGSEEASIRVWPQSLRKWVEALDYFVSFFPYHSRQLETLKVLHQSLIST